MLKNNAAALVGTIRDSINKLIVSELESYGVEGIVPTHGGILMFLYQMDGLSIKELTQKIARQQPTVTVLIDKLVKLGYVERKKEREDSRLTLIYLTEKGKELEPIFETISYKLKETIYGGLKDEEQKQLEYLLEHVKNRF
ncbi:MarR family transcriptional regulator [Paenibacillus polymyxa]|jgi:DNA-binding MarR family transcriptional regulator|uniref:MarR family winged helix-turn-helix transcriptional regulator n=1 Tax=Paenibacillus polymyxa TaxID=1406 RepID=UPI000D317AFA|nr:MarR family transcriptional regulator [Paenibacillus polymyxa]MBY0021585.1 MarR family transcriptional regulator [Paenibacillus polymyxa]MBY0055608.1 MarR family transcriptional regulator [Paenibacillus polymyxa]MBY0072478.1 MarR family transcriptional regulator [Paenibacillus polymyxa]MBY0081548.1 MarR family transcriptional regulator [Paenibacillus polymyxa]MBZ6442399.1 MarR family transcriptional regulator [Paenibacillus polymyxa]